MESELAPRRVVNLIEDDNSTEMEVYLEVEMEGQVFALLIPLDLPVHVVRELETEEQAALEPVEAEALPAMRKHIADALKPMGISAELHGDEMFLVGDPPDDFFEDCEMIEVRTEEDEEEYALVLELDTGDEQFLVLTPMVPDLFPAELVSDSEARPLSDAELSRLEDTFREALYDGDDEEEDMPEDPKAMAAADRQLAAMLRLRMQQQTAKKEKLQHFNTNRPL